jgi:hypothetical protein
MQQNPETRDLRRMKIEEAKGMSRGSSISDSAQIHQNHFDVLMPPKTLAPDHAAN